MLILRLMNKSGFNEILIQDPDDPWYISFYEKQPTYSNPVSCRIHAVKCSGNAGYHSL